MDHGIALVKRSFDTLYAESAGRPKLMCIALHPFIIGTPGRIGLLEDILHHISHHENVWMATGSEIRVTTGIQGATTMW